MKREEARARIEEIGIVPAVRLRSAEDARFATRAIAHGGKPIVSRRFARFVSKARAQMAGLKGVQKSH